jgi:hypothetical protein
LLAVTIGAVAGSDDWRGCWRVEHSVLPVLAVVDVFAH